MILDDIKAKRLEQLKREKEKISFSEIKKAAERISSPCEDFKRAIDLKGENEIAIIAEVKKASPSKGVIQPNFRPAETAEAYEKAGANAISCLTEEFYFKGSSEYLRQIKEKVTIPVLRKDFIIDPYQIYEARAIGADAVLLISAMLAVNELREYRKIAESLDMSVLAESHNEEELYKVLEAGCTITGINNRDLKTFEVRLETTKKLAGLIPSNCVIVTESGISRNADIRELKAAGARAALVGETLMKSGNIAETLSELTDLRDNRNEY
ncbi:MAG: indole-3-glycerol phosphate synthase TrpC [Bacteroides sp.]|nr:indole-3-glycerol phosphate synthase TrpC [Bacteroides sp.]